MFPPGEESQQKLGFDHFFWKAVLTEEVTNEQEYSESH